MVLFSDAMRSGLYAAEVPTVDRDLGVQLDSPAAAETFASKESGRVPPRTVRRQVTRTPLLAACMPSTV